MHECRGLQMSLEQAEEVSGICLMPRVRFMQQQLEAKDRQLQQTQVSSSPNNMANCNVMALAWHRSRADIGHFPPYKAQFVTQMEV